MDIPYIIYTLISEDGQRREEYLEKSADGWFYIEASISKSGFVYVIAKACDADRHVIDGIATYNGSAGADVGNILCATETPDDYQEFWDRLKAEVEATEPEVLYCERIDTANDHPDFDAYDMRIKAPGDDYVSLAVAYPKNAKKGSLKAVISLLGYGVYPARPEFCKDCLTVTVNSHAIPNSEPNAFYSNIRDNVLKGYGFNNEENKRPETTYWAKMLSRDLQAVRFFRDHELLNGRDYCFIGSSQGGMQAFNLAAHFDRASAVIANVPWLADIYAHELLGRRKHHMPVGEGVRYFDTAVAAKHVKCPVYIISGLGDATCNSSTQMALFNSINSPKHIEFYQNKVHSYTIPWDRNVYSLGDFGVVDGFDELMAQFYEYD
jgi:cephalosporin-C deacetylase-like acetyl esterase